jgi:hypothetical protein
MTLLEAGDRLVMKSGLYRMLGLGQEPRPPGPLRWWPSLILAAVTVGYAMIVRVYAPGFMDGGGSPQLRFGALVVASVLFFFGFSMANTIRYLGPRLASRLGGAILDERELAIRARAFAISGSTIAWLAVFGCAWIGVAPFVGGWRPGRPMEWIYLAMALEAWVLTLPVLIASWLQPRPAPDLGD